MRRGWAYKRCCKCGHQVGAGRCKRCGWNICSWTFVVDTAPPGFPRRQKSQGGFGTRTEALDAMSRFQVEMQDCTYVQPTRLTTGQYLEAWLAEMRARGLVRPTTIKTYDVAIRVHISPRLGGVPVQQLTRRRIKDLYNTLSQNGRSKGTPGRLSPKSVHNIHRTFHRALEDAIVAHRIGTVRKEMRWWTPGELHAFLTAVEMEPSFALWRLAASTGMRRGALLGLQWSHVDLESGLLAVQRQLVRNGDSVAFGPPKTGAGRRTIYVDGATLDVLRTSAAADPGQAGRRSGLPPASKSCLLPQ